MNLRSYIRGIAIGTVVTAGILHFTFEAAAKPMTDEQIISRAKELGMIENTVLVSGNVTDNDSDINQNEIIDNKPSTSSGNFVENDEGIIVNNSDTESDNNIENSDIIVDISDDSTVSTQDDSSDSESESVEYVTITVVRGDSSYSVAKKVYDAGLVDSTAEYDQYLCSNGYDKVITVGTHRIPVDATKDEIAKILTSKAD